jgi:hypothetical protein
VKKFSIVSFTRGLFLENAYYKIFSAVLVSLLYVGVLGDSDSEIALLAPVRVATIEDAVLVNEPATQVQVTVRGRWNVLQRFGQKGEFSPVVLRPTKTEGTEMLRIEGSMFDLPSGLQITNIQPTFIRAELKPRASKRVPLRARTVGKPTEGHTLGEITLKPATVEISGPREEVLRTRFVTTDPIDVTDRKASFVEQLELRYDSPNIRDELAQPVQASVTIKTIEIERELENLELRAVNTSLVAAIEPATVKITVRGPRPLVQGLDSTKILASIDLSDIKTPGLYQKKATISNLPLGITLVDSFPTDFQVKVASPAPQVTP